MLVSIIRTAIEKRGIFLMLSFLVIGLGLFSYQYLASRVLSARCYRKNVLGSNFGGAK
jgi:hypothetical protein